MSKTKGDCKALMLRLIDEATRKGISIPDSKNADYKDKFNFFINDAQIYVSQFVKIPEVFQVTQNPIVNMLGLFQGFDMQQYLPGKTNIGTNNIITLPGCKSYYLEIDNVATITVRVNGIVTQTINNALKGIFTAYKANTGALSTDVVTFTFSGNYPYSIRNTGFYEYAFPLDADVPVYMPYTEYPMPANFMKFDNIIIKSDPRVYDSYIAYKWENNKKVILNYYDKGSFDIHYWKYPTEILPTDADSTLMSVEDKAIDLVVLQCAIMATSADNQALSAWLRSLYGEKIQNVTSSEALTEATIQTVYAM